MTIQDLLPKIVSLSKRRGFIFQSSEIYGGLKSAYDFGPLGVELKRNIAAEWWKSMVHEREDIVGIDASIMMHPKVWQASGHLSGFSDPLVDCLNCKERFRADKAPKIAPGTAVTWVKGGKSGGEKVSGAVGEVGYVCPQCGSSTLSGERQFNLMFRTSIGPVDPIESVIDEIYGKNLDRSALREKIDQAVKESAIYLRPETAQAMFVQFMNVQQTMSMKVPFGIAQQGKSFRNEITTEKFIFRTCEFEQMEMEFFIKPGTDAEWFAYWKSERLKWFTDLGIKAENLRIREHAKDELSHYSTGTADIEYMFPWGWGELEGIACRGNFDLTQHSTFSGKQLIWRDQVTNETYIPHVIEPALGTDRAILVSLLDAYVEDEIDGNPRTVLKFHPRLAPYKVAVFPLLRKDGHPEKADQVYRMLKERYSATYDDSGNIGRRYRRQDEAGTPVCVTIDHQTFEDETVTVRDRDSLEQHRVKIDALLPELTSRFGF